MGGAGIWWHICCLNSNHDADMKDKTYYIIRKVHLYASLSTVTFLLMYLVTSYLMIHGDLFKTYHRENDVVEIKVTPSEVSTDNWAQFMDDHHISGRLVDERISPEGDIKREYARAGKNFNTTTFKQKNLVEITTIEKSTAGTLVGLHRISGFEGPLVYDLYAIMLDLVGISLILFALTGMILWLKLLNNNLIAWMVLLSGFVYVTAIIAYLLIV